MEAHPDSGSPLEPFIPSQAVSTEGKRTRLHQTQSLFISGSGATKKRSGTPARVRLTALWNRMAWKPANRNYPFPRPARIRRRPTGRKHKPPQRKERSSPFSAVPPLPCIDGPAFALRRRLPPGGRVILLPRRAVFWDAGRASSSRNTGTAPASSWKCPKACTS